MISLNKVIIAGDVTNKPILKTIDNHKRSILKLAIKDFWLDKNKNKVFISANNIVFLENN